MITEYGKWKVGDKATCSVGCVEIVAFAMACKFTHAACVTVPGDVWVGLLPVESLATYVKPIEAGERVIDKFGNTGIVRHIEGSQAAVWAGEFCGLFLSDIQDLRRPQQS